MSDNDRERARAESAFIPTQPQQSDHQQAWADYQARENAIAANIARLRALRLERDAQQPQQPFAKKGKKRSAA
jgi:hypothetical protein